MKTHQFDEPIKYEIYKLIRKLEKNYFEQTILRALKDMSIEYDKEIKE